MEPKSKKEEKSSARNCENILGVQVQQFQELEHVEHVPIAEWSRCIRVVEQKEIGNWELSPKEQKEKMKVVEHLGKKMIRQL